MYYNNLPEAPLAEWMAALHRHKELGVRLSRFNDPSNPTQPGRVLVQFGAATKNPAFQAECPTLCALYRAYQAASESFCVMITWRDALWGHCDLRALVKSLDYEDGNYAASLASKLDGPGPKEHIVLYGHGLVGETSLTYGVVPACNNKKKTFRLPRKDLTTVALKQTIRRQAGQATRNETFLHAACATATPRADGSLEVSRIPFNDEGSVRLLHGASGTGEHGVSIALLASVYKTREEALLSALSAIKQEQQEQQPEDPAALTQWLSSSFRLEAADFPRAHPGGTGGLTVEEQRERCTLDQDVASIGMVVGNGDGTGTAHTTPEWKDVCTLDQDVASIGMVIGNGDGTGTAHTTSEWADVTKETAAAKGLAVGAPTHDRDKNCDLLDKSSQSPGWYTRTRSNPSIRTPSQVVTSYVHPVLAPQGRLSFKAAKTVAAKAGAERTTQKSIVAALAASSSDDPMTL